MKTQDKSINNAEHIYEVPKLDKKTIQEIIANPYETRSGRGSEMVLGVFMLPRKSVHGSLFKIRFISLTESLLCITGTDF